MTPFTFDEPVAANMAKAAAASKRPYKFGPGPAPGGNTLYKGGVWSLAKMAKLQDRLLASGAIRYAPCPPLDDHASQIGFDYAAAARVRCT